MHSDTWWSTAAAEKYVFLHEQRSESVQMLHLQVKYSLARKFRKGSEKL